MLTERLLASPRAEDHIERLAAYLSDGPAAEEEIYRRLVHDIGVARRDDVAARVARFDSGSSERHLIVDFTPEAKVLADSGELQGWNCVNRRFAAQPSDAGGTEAFVRFDGNLDLRTVIDVYRELPGVVQVIDAGGVEGPSGPPFGRICVTRSADDWHYFFDPPHDLFDPEPVEPSHFVSRWAEGSPIEVERVVGSSISAMQHCLLELFDGYPIP